MSRLPIVTALATAGVMGCSARNRAGESSGLTREVRKLSNAADRPVGSTRPPSSEVTALGMELFGIGASFPQAASPGGSATLPSRLVVRLGG